MKTWILETFFVFHFILLHHVENVPLVAKLQFGSWFREAFLGFMRQSLCSFGFFCHFTCRCVFCVLGCVFAVFLLTLIDDCLCNPPELIIVFFFSHCRLMGRFSPDFSCSCGCPFCVFGSQAPFVPHIGHLHFLEQWAKLGKHMIVIFDVIFGFFCFFLVFFAHFRGF